MSVPGFMGLNTQQAGSLLGPEWATALSNAVIDESSRVAARKGYTAITTSAISSQPIVQLYELVESDGGTELIAFTDSDVYSSTNGGTSWASIEGSLAIDDGDWTAVNFNDTIFAARDGEAPAIYTGTGTFTAVADANCPKGGVVLSAFGRVWLSNVDGHQVHYSALLDATDWTSSDSGVIDLWNVWPDNDEIMGLAAHNGALVIFGRRTIVFYTDGQGSALGVDPTQMYVVDIIKGTGCIAKYSIQHVDGDIWFLSEHGLQSLGRLQTERSNPLNNLSKNVQDELSQRVDTLSDINDLRSVFSARNRVYLLALPSGSGTETGVSFVFDTRGRLEDGSARCMGMWTLVPRAVVSSVDNSILMQVVGADGEIGSYSNQTDDGDSYIFTYESGWMDLTQQGFLLFPKRYEGIFYSDAAVTVQFKWAFDFENEFNVLSKTFVGSGGGMEWNVGEWGEDEWSGGVLLRRGKTTPGLNGEYIKLGINSTIDGSTFAVQQLDLFAKIGRYA
jgi:hypothetical protein